MATFAFSVSPLEEENAVAHGLTQDEFVVFCRRRGTYVEEARLPATDVTPEVRIAGGLVADSDPRTIRTVYRMCQAFRRPPRGRTKRTALAFARFVRDAPYSELVTGTPAVYSLVRWLLASAEANPTGYSDRVGMWVAAVAATTVQGATEAGKMSHAHLAAKMTRVKEDSPKHLRAALQALLGLRELKRKRHAKAFVKVLGGTEPFAKPLDGRAVVKSARTRARSALPHWLASAVPVAGRVFIPVGKNAVYLCTGDLIRAEQVLAGHLNMKLAIVYKSLVAAKRPQASVAYVDKWFSRLTEAGANAAPGVAVHLCRAYKQAFAVGLAAHSGSDECLAAHQAELAEMPHVADCSAAEYAESLAALPIDRLQELGKIHKLCPLVPSIAPATAYARMKKTAAPNPAVPISADRPEMDDCLFEKCLRDEVAVALWKYDRTGATVLADGISEPSWWASWADKGHAPSHPGWSESLDLRGAAKAVVRSDLSAGVFKDSALCPDDEPVTATDVARREDSNMLLRRMMDPYYPTQEEGQNAMLDATPRVMKGDQKPENYKAPLRLFYEAKAKDRIGMGWIEECIQEVAKHHPCHMVGAGPRTVAARAQDIMSAAEPGTSKRFFSFDLSNWSAGMSSRVQEASGALWSEVFDDPRMAGAYKCMKGATVYVQKDGALAGFVNGEANFEGLDGKAMTMVHIALMSATVARWRDLIERDDLGVSLLAYIDDGLAGLVLPASKADALFREFLKCVEEVYQYYQFSLSAPKCFPSDRLATFLNEVYYAGTHIVSCTKAALRVAAEPKEAHDSLPARLAKLSGGARGAVVGGMPPITAGLFLYAQSALELIDWFPTTTDALARSPYAVALMLVSPPAYGGFGLPTVATIGKTGTGRGLGEGISAMQSFAISLPALRPVVLARLRTPLRPRSASAQLRNPTGQAGTSAFRMHRIETALSKALPSLAGNASARSVLTAAATFDLEAYATSILRGNETVSATALKLAWSAAPVALAESFIKKFETGRSMLKVLGRATMAAIMRDQRADALNAFATFL